MKKIVKPQKIRSLSTLSLYLFFTLVCVCRIQSFATDSSPRRLYLGLDAVPHSVFVEAQKRGFFKDFRPPSKVISVFPTLSNYAWSVILNTETLESYQAKYYHHSLNRIVGRLLYEVGKPTFPNKFDFCDNRVLKKVIAYVSSGGSIKGEMKHLVENVLASNQPRLFFAFSGTSDIVAHMKGEKGLFKLLKVVDREITWLRKEHLNKFKEPLAVTLLSDHGNTMLEGKIIEVNKLLKENHFHRTKKLMSHDDVVYHSSGILSVALFYIQEPRKIELAQLLATQHWADVVVTHDKRKGVFLIISQKGALSFEYEEENNNFRIQNVIGEDPLGLLQQNVPIGKWISQREILEASVKTKYPDSLMRIQRGLTQSVNHPASVIVSLKRGWESGSKFMKFLSIFKGRAGTHGGLSTDDSLGFLSSTDYDFPEWVPSREIHNLIEGHDFERRFEALTLLQEENGKCVLRFGQPLLDIPNAAYVQFTVQTYDYQRQHFSKSYDLYEVRIPAEYCHESLFWQPRFLDVTLPKTFALHEVCQCRAQILDANHRALARLQIGRFQIMSFKGYKTFSLQKIFKSPKKHSNWN